jgi:hypothetical protein
MNSAQERRTVQFTHRAVQYSTSHFEVTHVALWMRMDTDENGLVIKTRWIFFETHHGSLSIPYAKRSQEICNDRFGTSPASHRYTLNSHCESLSVTGILKKIYCRQSFKPVGEFSPVLTVRSATSGRPKHPPFLGSLFQAVQVHNQCERVACCSFCSFCSFWASALSLSQWKSHHLRWREMNIRF